jgi:hypothetical protein
MPLLPMIVRVLTYLLIVSPFVFIAFALRIGPERPQNRILLGFLLSTLTAITLLSLIALIRISCQCI